MAASFQQKRTTGNRKAFLRPYLTAFSWLPSFWNAGGAAPVAAISRPRSRHLLLLLCRREGGNDFFEARIATQRVPEWQQLQFAVGDSARGPEGDGKLFAGEVFVANPGSDHREVFDHGDSVNRILFHRKKLNCAPAFAQRFLLPFERSVDQTQHA